MGTQYLRKAAFDVYFETEAAPAKEFSHKFLKAAMHIDRLESALREIAECDGIHTKLNQERLCCRFQGIAMRALDVGEEENTEPMERYSVELELNIDPKLHEALALKAAASHQSLNQLINESIRLAIAN